MRELITVIAIMTLALLGACGGDDPTIEVDEADEANLEATECVAEWDGFVEEWNNLTDEERNEWDERSHEETGSYDGWALFAAEHGYPETYEEHCE